MQQQRPAISAPAATSSTAPADHPPVTPGSPSAPPRCPFASLVEVGNLDRTFAVTRYGDVAFTAATSSLLASVGGAPGIVKITTRFYEKFHSDAYLKQFLGRLQQPLETHAHRLGMYIAEMMGDETKPWHLDTRTRPSTQILLATKETVVVKNRQTAHYCAWNSLDRPKELAGRRFKLDDCRIWMRLMFWAVRDCGFDETTPFFNYFARFIAFFISIYENTARSFTLQESRWSMDKSNTDAYIAAGRRMDDVIGVPLNVALRTLPKAEHDLDSWIFDDAVVVSGV